MPTAAAAYSAPDTQPWTTSRCNRLLRPIASRLTTLRRTFGTERRSVNEARKASAATKSKTAAGPSTTRPRQPRGFEDDEDWHPGAKPSRTRKKTYGGQKRKTAVAHTRRATGEGENDALVPRSWRNDTTPLVNRLKKKGYESPAMMSSPLRDMKAGRLVDNVPQIKRLAAQMPNFARLIEGLLDAYAKLLQATHASEPRRRKGARSLMSTCLGKMPAYIELEEYFAELDKEEADDDEDRDISDEIYAQLEDMFSTGEGTGWVSLKEVVRAHGTALICDAFADGVLGPQVFVAVIALCRGAKAWQETEKIFWTFLPELGTLAFPLCVQSDIFRQHNQKDWGGDYMYILQEYVTATHSWGFYFDLLAHMVSEEIMPLEWLCTDSMYATLRLLQDAIVQENSPIFSHALRLLQTIVTAAVGLPDDSVFEAGPGDIDVVRKQIKPSARAEYRAMLQTVFGEILATLAGAALISQYDAELRDSSTVHSITGVLDSLAVGLWQRGDIRADLELLDSRTEDMQSYVERALWVMAAACAVHVDGCTLSPDMIALQPATLVRAFTWVCHQYSCADIDVSAALATLPLFLRDTAHCAGNPYVDRGFVPLQGLVEGILALGNVRLPHRLWSLKRVALETSIVFAEKTKQLEHAQFAREVEKGMSLRGRVVIMDDGLGAEATPSAPRGYRLEEGIGEWVPCTPFPAKKKEKLKKRDVESIPLADRAFDDVPEWTRTIAASNNVGGRRWDYNNDLDEDERQEERMERRKKRKEGSVPDSEAEEAGDEDEDYEEDGQGHWKLAPVDEEQLWGDARPTSSPDSERSERSSVLGKRQRTMSSPKVVIPFKRMNLGPAPKFYASTDDDADADGPRRSRRSLARNQNLKQDEARPRRTSLRTFGARRNYAETLIMNDYMKNGSGSTSLTSEEQEEEEEEVEDSADDSEDADDSSDVQNENDPPPASPPAPGEAHEDDVDELGKTPAGMKMQQRAAQSYSRSGLRSGSSSGSRPLTSVPAASMNGRSTRATRAKAFFTESSNRCRRSRRGKWPSNVDGADESEDELSFVC